MATKEVKPYGEWKSPITSATATANASVFQDLKIDVAPNGKEVVYWTELRYDDGGRYVVVSCEVGTTDHKDWTPSDFNARILVHEYGGGNFFVFSGVVYFSNLTDQRLYKQTSPDSQPVPVTAADTNYRYANGQMSAKTKMIYIVREDHSKVKSGQAREPTNSIVCVNPSTQQENVLACGVDFYSSPKVSPDGKKICWMQWLHPNMPWNDTEIWTAQLTENGNAVVDGSSKKVAGGKGISVMQPSWAPSGELMYISDETNWWNLYRLSSSGQAVNLCPIDKELGGPHWTFGESAYATNMSRKDDLIVSFGGVLSLLKEGGDRHTLDTGFVVHGKIQLSDSGKVFCAAQSPVKFSSIIAVDLADGKVELIKQCQEADIDEGHYSKFTEICYATSEGHKSYANFYPPMNKDYEGPEDALPPLLVKAHGGPTANASPALQLKIQYFTSRGFAVLDVNYRGSTGYGRDYRLKLEEKWGIYDVADCCAGALHLVDTKQVDKDRLCIDGGSAGGFTTLACLAFEKVFKAGASLYGVADLEMLAKDTHKFEARYLDSIIGAYPEKRDVYIKRSPIHNIDGFNSPIIFFQGTEDKIVPPNQAELMYASVKAKNIPCSLILFEGEQHGFRKSENIQTALDGELYFFGKVCGFVPHVPADIAGKIPIDNL